MRQQRQKTQLDRAQNFRDIKKLKDRS